MMNTIKALIMSIGMFSVFPVPKNNWNENYAPLVIPALPVVGGFIGAVWYAAAFALVGSNIPIFLQSAVIMLLPFVLSGFLHIDGFMDTSDAIFSRRELEEKRRILKDSHVGAFAVIALACLFLLQFGAVHTLLVEKKALLSFVFIPVMSRSVAGLALLNLKPISEKGLAATFKAGAEPRHTAFIAVITVIGLISAFWLTETTILPPLGAALLSGVCTAVYVYKQMQGISGDLCGCIITVSEVSGLLCLAVI